MQKSTFVTASVIAIGATLFMSSAGAQSVAGVTGSQGSGDNSGTPGGLEEVVVTAQRREERNQTVPIAITAFTSAQLQQQNITTAQDLNGLVPSLVVSPNGQASRETEGYTLRGMGPTYEGASAVVVYLDEVPLPQAFTTNEQGGPGNYLDLDTLQVLAGPQGTLFGRNTTGGAVLLVPHKPTNDFGGYLQVSGGNYGYNAVEGVVNVPIISDKLLVRVAGTYQDRDGYTHDYVWNKDRDNRHYFAGQMGVTFRPTDGVENYLLAYSSYSNNNGTGYVNNGIVLPALLAAGDCTGACSVYKYNANLAKQIGPRGVLDDVDEFETTRTWGLIDKTSIDLNEQLTINNIVSYQTYWKNYSLDEAGLPLELADQGANRPTFAVPSLARFGFAKNGFNDSTAFGPRDDLEQVTEELQLQGNLFDNHLNFAVGGFYFNEQPRGDQLNRPTYGCANIGNCTPLVQTYGVSNESEAVYAQSTLNMGVVTPALEDLRLTAGYRYTWDTVDGATNFYLPVGGGYNYCINTGAVTTNSAQCAYASTLHSSAPTFTFGADYKPIDNVLVYAKFSRGYKSGGFNAFAVRPSNATFAPEYVNSFETGFKSDWRLGTVPARLNVTWYRSSYSDIQKAAPDVNNGLVGSQIVQGSALIEGLEAEATIRPISAVELGGSMSYTDARLTSCGTNCLPFGVPRWIYNLHGTVDLPVPEEWGKMSLYGAFSFVGQQVTALAQPGGTLNAYGLLNLSAKWDSIFQSDFDLELFATNVTNKLYRITNSNIASSGFYASVYGEPQMYGARLRYRFGSQGSEPAAAPAAYVPPPAQPVAPAPVAKSYLVFFDFNKSDLSSQAVQIVNQAAANAGAAHVTQLTVTGHTDTVGSDAYNMRLSRRRAESVAAQLEKDGISSSEIEIVAKGKRDLLVPTADGVKEPQNRRVQIVYDNGATS